MRRRRWSRSGGGSGGGGGREVLRQRHADWGATRGGGG